MADPVITSPERDARGRIRKGHCLNRNGRPPENRIEPELPSGHRQAILAKANRTVSTTNPDGRRERMTLFETRVLGLGSASGHKRQACQTFVELVLLAAAQEERLAPGTQG